MTNKNIKTGYIIAAIAVAVVLGSLVGSSMKQEGNTEDKSVQTAQTSTIPDQTEEIKEVDSQTAPAGGGSCGGACGNPSCGGSTGGACGCGG
ncbi:MAG: hypothetical protein ABH851_09380 [Methanobacteriota archaeon]